MRMGGFWGIRRVVRFEGEVFFFQMAFLEFGR
jgi:hypothetical protein